MTNVETIFEFVSYMNKVMDAVDAGKSVSEVSIDKELPTNVAFTLGRFSEFIHRFRDLKNAKHEVQKETSSD